MDMLLIWRTFMPASNKTTKLRKFISYYRPYLGLFAADMLSSLMVAALGLVLPLCVRHITNDILQSGNADVLSGILRVGALMLCIIAAKTGFGIFQDYKGHDLGARIERDIRKELFSHLQKLPLSFYDSRNTGELMSRLTNDLAGFSEVCHHVPEKILTTGIQFFGSIIILLIADWRLAMAVYAVMPVMAIYSVVYYRKLQKAYKENRERIADINAAAQESISGMRVVKSFASGDAEICKFTQANGRFYTSRVGICKSEALLYSAVEHFFTPLITVVIAVAGGFWISGGSLDIASLLMFILYAGYLTGPIPGLASVIPFYQSGISGFARVKEILDISPEISDKENAVQLEISKGHVRFVDVSFRYGNDSAYALRNVNLSVSSGETVAIVGRSGIGKTTLCSLVPRFYEVSNGSVLIDGINVKDATQDSLRRQIGVVSQETFLFSGTILDNILYGRPGASRAEAINAAKMANAHDFISEFPQGYDTDIGQGGVKLSG
jgi:ATP-binding cassette subfamily B protein